MSEAELLELLARSATDVAPDERTEFDPRVARDDLFDDLSNVIGRFIVIGAHELTVVVLWIAHTWTFSASDTTPYLFISSPEKQSGKSSLLKLLQLLVAKPIKTANISEAALFRLIGKGDEDGATPTILFDEIDTIFGPKARDREDMRGLLDEGFERGGMVYRCVGEGAKMQPVKFSVYAPKAFAGIGRATLPDTISDRSIEIKLKRKARTEPVERFRRRAVAAATAPFRERLDVWAALTVERLSDAYPNLPDELDDRAQDFWEPLLAIADSAGGTGRRKPAQPRSSSRP